MRKTLMIILLATLSLEGQAATAVPKDVTPKAADTSLRVFTLTQALAVLYKCPEARFESDSVIALGGVLTENKARIDAAPLNSRMDLMSQLVQEESLKGSEYAKKNKIDCKADVEPAAAYWNKLIARMASEQKPGPKAPVTALPAAPRAPVVRLTPNPQTPAISGVQLP